jgi:hypothetical protein
MLRRDLRDCRDLLINYISIKVVERSLIKVASPVIAAILITLQFQDARPVSRDHRSQGSGARDFDDQI